MPPHTILTNHRPYIVSIHVYSLTLLNVACRKPIIPPIFVPIIKNVMEQNLIGFPNSMYLHVRPYTPYFGFSYRGMGGVPTMWPPLFNPLVNPMISPKLVMGIVQVNSVTNCGELLDKDKDYSMRKHKSFLLENCTMTGEENHP